MTTQTLPLRILIPIENNGLEVTVQVRYYSTFEIKKLYFPEGTYTPEKVAQRIANLESIESDRTQNQVKVKVKILDHSYLSKKRLQFLKSTKRSNSIKSKQ